MSYSYSYGEEFAGFMIFYLIYYLLAFGLGIASYVLRSLGTYTIAKRRGLNNPWMAWVPVLDYWLLGSISDQYQYVTKGKNKNKRKWLIGLYCGQFVVTILMVVFMLVSTVGAASNMSAAISEEEEILAVFGLMGTMLLVFIPIIAMSIALSVIRYMALYDLYRSCDPKNSVMFLVLSILLSVTEPFFVFACRKKDQGMPPRRPQPNGYIPQQPYYPPQQPVYQPPVYQPPQYQQPQYQPPEPPAYQPQPPVCQAPAAEPVAPPTVEPVAPPVVEPAAEPESPVTDPEIWDAE